VRATWLHEGLDAFERSLRGAHEIYRRFGGSVAELAARFDRGESDRDALESLVRSSRQLRDEVAARLEVGRDRLLERSSFRADRAEPLRAEIAACDEDTGLEELIIRLLEHHGVEVDEIAPRTYRLEHARSADATRRSSGWRSSGSRPRAR